MSERPCPCCSGKSFAGCCGPLLAGARAAATAEELLRSRYTAFVEADVGYVERTRHPRSPNPFDEAAVREWAEGSEWLGLEVGAIEGGGPGDAEGAIDFVARFKEKGKPREHREHALFRRDGERWAFVDGDWIVPETVRRDAPKVGRNDPCPCGSGKKHKKCCGA